jgi:hypothetical protein
MIYSLESRSSRMIQCEFITSFLFLFNQIIIQEIQKCSLDLLDRVIINYEPQQIKSDQLSNSHLSQTSRILVSH